MLLVENKTSLLKTRQWEQSDSLKNEEMESNIIHYANGWPGYEPILWVSDYPGGRKLVHAEAAYLNWQFRRAAIACVASVL